MRDLEVRKFNPSILRNATLITEGKGYMRTYNLNNGYIYKEIKDENVSGLVQTIYHDDFVDCLTKKLALVKYLSDEFIVLPKTVYTKNGEVVGYIVPYLNMVDIDKALSTTTDLECITNIFIGLCNAVKQCNKEGIIFPDLGNSSNIFYNKKTGQIKFIDYDGLQIGDCDSFNVSSLMSKHDNPTFKRIKYFDRRRTIFTENFDKASLLALYLYYTTKTNMTKFPISAFKYEGGNYRLKEEEIDKYLSSIGLLGTSLEEDIKLVYDDSKNNKYPETSIKRLNKTHILSSVNTFKTR